jgi:hypothetical protein
MIRKIRTLTKALE